MSRVKELYWDAIIENSEQSIWEAEQDAAHEELYGQRTYGNVPVDISSGQRERIRKTPGRVVAKGK